MKLLKIVIALVLGLVAVPQAAARAAEESAPSKHWLSLRFQGETDKFEWVMDNHLRVKTLEDKGLRAWVLQLPRGSEIHFGFSCTRVGGENAYYAHLSAFAAFCKSHEVTFIKHMAG